MKQFPLVTNCYQLFQCSINLFESFFKDKKSKSSYSSSINVNIFCLLYSSMTVNSISLGSAQSKTFADTVTTQINIFQDRTASWLIENIISRLIGDGDCCFSVARQVHLLLAFLSNGPRGLSRNHWKHCVSGRCLPPIKLLVLPQTYIWIQLAYYHG